MAFRNINAKISVVDSQSQHPFIVACLFNAVSVRCNTFINLTFNAMHSIFLKFNMTGDLFSPTLGSKAPLHG